MTTWIELKGIAETKSEGKRQIPDNFIHIWNTKKQHQGTDKTKPIHILEI